MASSFGVSKCSRYASPLTSRSIHSAAVFNGAEASKMCFKDFGKCSTPFSPNPMMEQVKTASSLRSSLPLSVHRVYQKAHMATMSATNGHNQSCCNTPPKVAPDGYVPKGTYEQLGGMRTYVTGAADATKGLISVFDIFGFFNQTLQGADILATSKSHQTHKVFIPDWFKGHPAPIEWYPPDTEDKQKKLGEWFGKNDPQAVANALPDYVKALQAANPSITSWGILGYCWGGKVVELVLSADTNPFTVAAAAHPAMIDPADAEKISVPYIMLASGEDPAETVKEFESRLTVPHYVEIFTDQVHGWMAARGDLSNHHVKKEYARGYERLLEFFDKHWK